MADLKIYIPDEEYEEVKKKADGAGLSISAYIRSVLKNPPPKDQAIPVSDNSLRAVRALVPTIAEAFGITQKAGRAPIDKLSEMLLERYDKAYVKE